MKKGFILCAVINMFFAISCGNMIGDSCSSNTDCGSGRICDKSQPGGYCTITPCEEDTCPSESACIEFSKWDSFCMLKCDKKEDCRKEYVCVQNFGSHPFCNQTDAVK
jgi:hypothetical protein